MESEMTYQDKEIPPMDLEKALAASVYLAETGVPLHGGVDEICYRLTVELAVARHLASEQAIQAAKYKALLKIERKLSDDILDENTELEESNNLLALEADMNSRGLDEMTRRFDACMNLLDEFTATIDWNDLLNEG